VTWRIWTGGDFNRRPFAEPRIGTVQLCYSSRGSQPDVI